MLWKMERGDRDEGIPMQGVSEQQQPVLWVWSEALVLLGLFHSHEQFTPPS